MSGEQKNVGLRPGGGRPAIFPDRMLLRLPAGSKAAIQQLAVKNKMRQGDYLRHIIKRAIALDK